MPLSAKRVVALAEIHSDVLRLKEDLSQHLDEQHARLLKEVNSLREDILSRVQQELQALRQDGIKQNEPSPECTLSCKTKVSNST